MRVKYSIAIAFLCLIHLANGQNDLPISFIRLTETNISKLEFETGKILYSTKIPEQIIRYTEVEKENILYVLTRHNVYVLNNNNGEIIEQYQFCEVLTKTNNDMYDPNVNIMPLGITKSGIGFYYILHEAARKYAMSDPKHLEAMSKTIIHQFNIKNKSTSVYKNIDNKEYDGVVVPRLIKNKILLTKKAPTTTSILLELYSATNVEDISIYNIPVLIKGNEFGLNINNVKNYYFNNLNFKNNMASVVQLNVLDNDNIYQYTFDIELNKPIDFKYLKKLSSTIPNINLNTINCEQNYDYKIICDEKQAMPSAPVFEVPKKTNKKAMALWNRKADSLNLAYKKTLKKYMDSLMDNSSCELEVYTIKEGKKEFVDVFFGATSVTIYNDHYIFYHDDLEYVMYDISKKSIAWSISM